jgi:16S rRNA (uracil1498-N3)-methyltransferase
MRLTRVFAAEPLSSGAEIRLAPAAAGHVVRVLRLKSGADLTLFDGTGGEYTAHIVDIRRDVVRVQVGVHSAIERESPLTVTLAQGISRGERMDWVIQKATELGVHSIVPLLTERSIVRLDARQSETKQAHWRAVAIGACEQCGRNRIPHVAAPIDLREWLARPRAAGLEVMLDARAAAALGTLGASPTLRLLIGPEGGLAPGEREAARSAGFESRRLGPRILRTETAALAALAVLQATHGDLGNDPGPTSATG